MYGHQQEFLSYIESEKEFDCPSWDDYLTDEDKIFIGERVRDIVDLVIRKRSTHNE